LAQLVTQTVSLRRKLTARYETRPLLPFSLLRMTKIAERARSYYNFYYSNAKGSI
jgi:hypothetical protein